MTSKEQPKTECCMCGDFGFSDQLFKCKICQFRSQHRYCSNLYPKTESFTICNWCLSQKEDSPNSSNSSSSYKNNGSTEDEGKNKRIKNCIPKKGLIRGNSGGVGVLHLQLQKPLMKKPKSPSEEKSPLASTSPSVLVSTRKRIITNGALEEKLRRTRSENIINSSNSVGATKQVFRNKVRRYKLLDEVSS